MAIVWDPVTMATHISRIDLEHQEWIRRFNEFDAAVTAGHGGDLIEQLLLFMLDYSNTHFAHEEELVVQYNPLANKLNHLEHEKFRRRMNELRARIQAGGASEFDIDALANDLQEWLINHICTVDVRIWHD